MKLSHIACRARRFFADAVGSLSAFPVFMLDMCSALCILRVGIHVSRTPAKDTLSVATSVFRFSLCSIYYCTSILKHSASNVTAWYSFTLALDLPHDFAQSF